jgi:hypothetical protein
VVIAVQDIRAAYWQPRLSHLGEIVEDVEDIHQCLTVILTTQQGSDALRPDFALNLMDYVDRPIGDVSAGLITDIIDAVTRWEQRCQILKAEVTAEAPATLILSLTWRPVNAANSGTRAYLTTVEIAPVTGTAPDEFVTIPFLASLTVAAVDGGTF